MIVLSLKSQPAAGVPPYDFEASLLDSQRTLLAKTQGENSNLILLVPEGTPAGLAYVQVEVRDEQGRQASNLADPIPITIQQEASPWIPVDKIAGDANGDNTIDILDLVSIIDYIVSDTACTSMLNADANGDGNVDILDLVWIIDTIVGN